ncbi:hypothetical protein BLD44_028370 [Mastigocladus laminosus UU774]|nr:hypothetical protein BLD44_028370 [Mastigocladus laminosus UU774]
MKTLSADEFFDKGSGIVTLCCSTKFFFEAMECNRRLTFKNWIVLACGSWGHSFNKYSVNHERDYSAVKELHFQKIKLSQAIVVVSDGSGYVGSSTKAEIKFAEFISVPVFYFDGEDFMGVTSYQPPQLLSKSSVIESFAKQNGGLGF